MIRTLLLSGALALGVSLTGAAPAALAQPASASAMPTDAMGFITAAGQSDQFEIQSGQLAASQGGSGKVRDFGKQMVKDHAKSTAMVMKAASTAGMTPPAGPPPLRADQQQMLGQLQRLHGADFDRTYVQQQMQAHDEALMLHQNYARSGDTPALKSAAAQIVPVVRMHRSMLQGMAR